MKTWDKIGHTIINILTGLIVFLGIFTVYSYISLNILDYDYVKICNYTYFEVVSGSMSPAINKNDIVIIKLNEKYKENDIITFIDKDDFITHRVKKIDVKTVTTMGDANNTIDQTVDKKNVIGKVVKILPKAGIWKRVFTTPGVLILLIVTFFFFSLAFSYRGRPKKKKKVNKVKEETKIYEDIPILNNTENKDV